MSILLTSLKIYCNAFLCTFVSLDIAKLTAGRQSVVDVKTTTPSNKIKCDNRDFIGEKCVRGDSGNPSSINDTKNNACTHQVY